MKSILLASTFLFAIAGSALAADLIVYEPIPEPTPAVFVWTGGYVGLQGGYAWGKSPYQSITEGEGFYYAWTNFDPDGAFGGIYLGYNRQLANLVVLGIDADINAGDLTGGGEPYTWYRSNDDASGVDYDFENFSKMKWNGAVRGRVGYAFDRFLPYIAGGVSFGGYEFGAYDKRYDTVSFHRKDTLTGWNIGGGLEYAATDSVIVRGEYRYTDFGSQAYRIRGDVTIKLNIHDIRFGVAYKF